MDVDCRIYGWQLECIGQLTAHLALLMFQSDTNNALVYTQNCSMHAGPLQGQSQHLQGAQLQTNSFLSQRPSSILECSASDCCLT